jgi:cytoskeletal protein CcmA (bactofilin family)
MSEVTIQTVDEADIDTILAEDIDFNGKLTFKDPLMIKGKLKGKINATGDLYIGEKAEVEAMVTANMVSLKGKIRGNVVAHTRVELFASATVEGDITTPNVIMESGSRFNGICNMKPIDGEK